MNFLHPNCLQINFVLKTSLLLEWVCSSTGYNLKVVRACKSSWLTGNYRMFVNPVSMPPTWERAYMHCFGQWFKTFLVSSPTGVQAKMLDPPKIQSSITGSQVSPIFFVIFRGTLKLKLDKLWKIEAIIGKNLHKSWYKWNCLMHILVYL